MKLLVSLLLSVLLILTTGPIQAWGAVSPNQPESLASMVDEYLAETDIKQQDLLATVAQQSYLSQIVSVQIQKLEPEDFNLFLLYLMDRYIKNPSQRSGLFTLLKTLRETIAQDLGNTAQVEAGPEHFLIKGSYAHAVWILFGGVIGWKLILRSPLRTSSFVTGMQNLEKAALAKGPAFRLSYRVASNPFVWSAAAGASVGYLEYILNKNRTHRLDPLMILDVVQANLACELSYHGLELADRYDKLTSDTDSVLKVYPQVLKEMSQVAEQSQELLEEYPRLGNLDTEDRLFQNDLKHLPVSNNFQDFRKNLTDAELSSDGQCRQMSLTSLKMELEKMISVVKSTYDANLPATPPADLREGGTP